MFELFGIGLFTICTWGYSENGFSSYFSAAKVLLLVTFCIRRLPLFLLSSVSYIGVCSERTNKWKVSPSIVLTKTKVAPETFRILIPRRTITTTSILNITKKKQAKKFPKHWIYYPWRQKVSSNLSTKMEGVDEESIKSIPSILKRRSNIPGLESRTELPCIKLVLVNFFRTVSEAEAWTILSQKFFICLEVYNPAHLVSKVENWVICPSSVGLSNKGLSKGMGSGKSWYQELWFSRSSWNTLM